MNLVSKTNEINLQGKESIIIQYIIRLITSRT
jgi:hypothetical protein